MPSYAVHTALPVTAPRVLRSCPAGDAFTPQSIPPTYGADDLDEAYERGRRDGEAAARADLRRALDDCAAAVEATSVALTSALTTHRRALTEEMVDLAIEVASWLAVAELRDIDSFTARVKAAIGSADEQVTIVVSASVAPALADRLPNHVVRADPDLAPGDVRILGREGETDGLLTSGLRKAREALLKAATESWRA